MNTGKEAVVIEALPGLLFRVRLEENKDSGGTLLAHLAGKMKLHHIRIVPGDRVTVELSPDGTRGRIVRRL